MKGFLLILFSLLETTFSIVSTSTTTIPKDPKLCVNCKFFMKESFLTPDAYSKCTKFSFIEHDDFFVNGIKRPETKRYYYCSTARNFHHMCGIEGKKFEEKNKN